MCVQRIQEGKLDEAQELLVVKDTGGFESQYSEALGDIHQLKGNLTEAKSAYQKALDSLPAQSTYRQVLSVKIDNITTE